ncbi:hypothetical protein PIB30_026572 [Stylosanthes scabra]|uniref:GDSL esterase/lipase n=1 Tax=Stylosanthes scabra TaxID=79078 RepID=A0ABU6TB45_9FABA|nr:hypothetical protein [Stylosanthes scabra]
MASSRACFLTVALLLHVAASSIFISMATPIISSTTSSSTRCYKAIYSFGDSLADTGNDAYDDTRTLPSSQTLALNLPYGETYFHHPTGRWSDGRLIVDFIAEKMGLPLLKPYLGIKNGNIKDWNPTEGVNFAVAGATAVDSSFYLEKGIYNIATNYSLGVQLDLFMDLLPSICNSSSGCKEVLGSSLFLVGEIGGNDFNHPLFLYKSITEIRTYVPLVVNQISLAINKLINLGAKTLMVPGNFPLGCNFRFLIMYETADKSEYDEVGCLKWLNKFTQYYNKQLYAELNRLQGLQNQFQVLVVLLELQTVPMLCVVAIRG